VGFFAFYQSCLRRYEGEEERRKGMRADERMALTRTASSLSQSRNVTYVPAGSGNLLLQVPPQQGA
jgi:hypothetical protein